MIPAEQDFTHYSTRCAYFDRQDGNADGAVHFLGDSRFEGMDLSPASPYALDRGIGGDTMRTDVTRRTRDDLTDDPLASHSWR